MMSTVNCCTYVDESTPEFIGDIMGIRGDLKQPGREGKTRQDGTGQDRTGQDRTEDCDNREIEPTSNSNSNSKQPHNLEVPTSLWQTLLGTTNFEKAEKASVGSIETSK